jgi:Ca2+-binding EF-hand superfamily protein
VFKRPFDRLKDRRTSDGSNGTNFAEKRDRCSFDLRKAQKSRNFAGNLGFTYVGRGWWFSSGSFQTRPQVDRADCLPNSFRRKEMRLLLAGFAVAALMVPMDAFAQPGRGQDGQRGPGGRGGFQGRGGFGGNPIMQALDKNNDGELSSEEINGAVAALKALDKNKDGKIDREELRPDFVADMFARMDANKDGKLTKEEAGERYTEAFGTKSSVDLEGFRTIMQERMRNFGQRGDGARRPGGDGARRPGGDGARRPGGDRRPGGEGGDRPRRPGGDSDRPARPSNNSDIEL